MINADPNHIDSPLVQNIILSGRKALHKPPNQKEPITRTQVREIIDTFGQSDCTLMQLRKACYISLSFVLLFRHDEMAQLKANHLHPLPNDKGIKIFIPRSKTDIFRDGSYTYIPSSNDIYSPCDILKRYMAGCNIKIGEETLIFTALSFNGAPRILSWGRLKENVTLTNQLGLVCICMYVILGCMYV